MQQYRRLIYTTVETFPKTVFGVDILTGTNGAEIVPIFHEVIIKCVKGTCAAL